MLTGMLNFVFIKCHLMTLKDPHNIRQPCLQTLFPLRQHLHLRLFATIHIAPVVTHHLQVKRPSQCIVSVLPFVLILSVMQYVA